MHRDDPPAISPGRVDPADGDSIESLRALDDEPFARRCRWEMFRGSGPGGQKRNKTSSAVRVSHAPTGLSATASDSRSQATNKRRALQRLRCRIAIERRVAFDPAVPSFPTWFLELTRAGRLVIGTRHADYLPAMAIVLDVLAACGWSVSDAGKSLGFSTAALVRFLQADQKALAEVNRRRTDVGLNPLGARSGR